MYCVRWSSVAIALVLLGLAPKTAAQHLYIDVNGDGVHSSADRLNAGTTVLTLYLNSNHDRDISLQTCNSHTQTCGAPGTSQPLNVFSYTVALVAVGGAVQWGTFTPADGAYTPIGTDPSDSTSIEINRSRPVGTLTPPGLSILGSITATVLSGNPRIDVARGPTTANPSGFGTGFGTECSGFNFLNTYVLGDPVDPCGSGADWFDADGALTPTNNTPTLAAPESVSGTVGVAINAIVATATDPDPEDPLTITQTGMPTSLTFTATPGPSPRTATITGTPGPADVGTHSIVWAVNDGAGGAATDTTFLAIEDGGEGLSINAPETVSGSASQPITFNVSTEDSEGLPLTSFNVTGIPAGAVFAPDSGPGTGTFYWTPEPDGLGTFTVTFTAGNAVRTTTKTTDLEVTAPSGPRRARVPAEFLNLHSESSKPFLTRDPNGQVVVNAFVIGEIANEALEALGVAVGARVGNYMTARCPLENLSSLFDAPNVDALVAPKLCELLLDSSVVDIGLSGTKKLMPPFQGQSGDSVVIGIVDTGIDVDHPDFRRHDGVPGTTRLIGYWDQSRPSTPPRPVCGPHTVGYGTSWSDAAIQAGGISPDTYGHGTHVAGIAAGNGRFQEFCDPISYTGVAPEADLCIVKLVDPPEGPPDGTTNRKFRLQTSVVDGVDFVFKKAACAGKPAVVNLSLGSHEGPHDGTSFFDYFINALTGPGKIIVAAAGNDNLVPVHARADLKTDVSETAITFEVPLYSSARPTFDDTFVVSGWFDLTDSIAVTVTTPNGFVIGPVWSPGPGHSAQSQVGSGFTTDGSVHILVGDPEGCNQFFGPRPECIRNTEINITVTDGASPGPPHYPPATGTWEIFLTMGKRRASGTVDLYMQALEQTGGLRTKLIPFVQGQDAPRVIMTPASADSVIAVGAYVTKKCFRRYTGTRTCYDDLVPGNIAPFSSRGPRRDGVTKPDISAPGALIASALSSDATPDTGVILYDGIHLVLQGTSFAAPHVTGAVALLMSKPAWRTASPSQIRSHLKNTATRSAATDTIPNTWGAGKLNADSLLWPDLLALRILRPAKHEAE